MNGIKCNDCGTVCYLTEAPTREVHTLLGREIRFGCPATYCRSHYVTLCHVCDTCEVREAEGSKCYPCNDASHLRELVQFALDRRQQDRRGRDRRAA